MTTSYRKLDGRPVPDWQLTDGYLDFWGKVPNNRYWRAYVKGMLYDLSQNWDDATGDAETAETEGLKIHDDLEFGTLEMGVSDHGLLDGLGDDDHQQYHNDARGDLRYYQQSQVDSLISSLYGPSNDKRGNYNLANFYGAKSLTGVSAWSNAEIDLVSGPQITKTGGGWQFSKAGNYWYSLRLIVLSPPAGWYWIRYHHDGQEKAVTQRYYNAGDGPWLDILCSGVMNLPANWHLQLGYNFPSGSSPSCYCSPPHGGCEFLLLDP